MYIKSIWSTSTVEMYVNLPTLTVEMYVKPQTLTVGMYVKPPTSTVVCWNVRRATYLYCWNVRKATNLNCWNVRKVTYLNCWNVRKATYLNCLNVRKATYLNWTHYPRFRSLYLPGTKTIFLDLKAVGHRTSNKMNCIYRLRQHWVHSIQYTTSTPTIPHYWTDCIGIINYTVCNR